MITGLPTFGDCHAVDVLDDEGERLLAGLHETIGEVCLE